MVLIDIPMPKRCYTCPMNVYHEGEWSCNVNGREVGERGEYVCRPEWCPMKEVQE